MAGQLPDEAVEQIQTAIFAGQMIMAIKLYRQATNASLVDAKNFIDALQQRLWQESPQRFTVQPRNAGQLGNAGCSRAVVVVVLVLIMIAAAKLLLWAIK